MTLDVGEALARLRALCEVERRAERARFEEEIALVSPAERERRGRAVSGLVAKETGAGLHGRTVVHFARRDGARIEARLGPGDVVIASRGDATEQGLPRGVVLERGAGRISVAFDDETPEWLDEEPVRLDLSGDEVTFERCRKALDEVGRASGRLLALRKVLLGGRAPTFAPPRQLEPLDASLDPTQRAAVEHALSAHDVALVHGPPGTGKTTTVVEIVRQSSRRGEKVLVTAPSNHAVDVLVERLARAGADPLRLGHPARVAEDLRGFSLEARLESHPSRKLARELFERALSERRRLRTRRERGRGSFEEDRAAREQVRRLFQDARRLEEVALEHVIDRAAIVCATAAGAGHENLLGRSFALVVVDEASQATTPLALIAVARGERVVLAGDHRQLPPTVLSREAQEGGLSRTLFEDLIERFPDAARLLAVQYRMNAAISAFSNRALYEGRIRDHETVASHLLRDLAGIGEEDDAAREPLAFWDTAGFGAEETAAGEDEGRHSRENPREAEVVVARARALLALGLAPEAIAVITPYDAQAKRLRDLLPAEVEVDTVDGFQGREKEAVLVSLVRSNPEGQVGFLSDVRRTGGVEPTTRGAGPISEGVRRLNVAFTRARRRLEVVGDGATFGRSAFMAGFIEYAQEIGAWRSAFEIEMEPSP